MRDEWRVHIDRQLDRDDRANEKADDHHDPYGVKAILSDLTDQLLEEDAPLLRSSEDLRHEECVLAHDTERIADRFSHSLADSDGA